MNGSFLKVVKILLTSLLMKVDILNFILLERNQNKEWKYIRYNKAIKTYTIMLKNLFGNILAIWWYPIEKVIYFFRDPDSPRKSINDIILFLKKRWG